MSVRVSEDIPINEAQRLVPCCERLVVVVVGGVDDS